MQDRLNHDQKGRYLDPKAKHLIPERKRSEAASCCTDHPSTDGIPSRSEGLETRIGRVATGSMDRRLFFDETEKSVEVTDSDSHDIGWGWVIRGYDHLSCRA